MARIARTVRMVVSQTPMADHAEQKFAGKHAVILGCGYLGSAVAAAILARGGRVTGLTHNLGSAAALSAAGATPIVANLADDSWHEQIAPDADLNLNCVGSGGASLASYRSSYYDGMRSAIAWATRCSPAATFVYTSSTSVYPQNSGELVDEGFVIERTSSRSGVLIATEQLLIREMEDGGDAAETLFPRRFILRLAGIYGPERFHFKDQVESGVVNGHADTIMNLIHRDDAVAAVLAVWDSRTTLRRRIYNVVDSAPSRRGEVAAWLAQRAGVGSPTFTGATAAGREPPRHRLISNAALRSELGWEPRYPSFREGCKNL